MTLETMQQLETETSLLNFIDEHVDGIENIDSVEENCGSVWITLKDGRVMTMLIYECENDNNE